MKKLFLLVSCVAALLVVSNMSFAAEEAADAVPCACGNCDCAPMPFAYPPQGLFGGKFASFGTKCTLGHRGPQALPYPALPCPEVLPEACMPYPYAYPPSKAYLRAVRRVAKLTPPPFQPCPPMPVSGVVPAPPVFGPPPAAFGVPTAPAFASTAWQAGYKNSVSQRAPVINFLSVVRAPRSPFEPYPGFVAPGCPCQETE